MHDQERTFELDIFTGDAEIYANVAPVFLVSVWCDWAKSGHSPHEEGVRPDWAGQPLFARSGSTSGFPRDFRLHETSTISVNG